MNVGSSRIDAMNQAQRILDAKVHLHAEVPFVALSGLVHFRIGLTRHLTPRVQNSSSANYSARVGVA